ncbi:hypothetical protein V6N13_076585 [Hibiscus sabdariffa]|uniref:Uncharacterized protein n=1 Tax=Hibiscus sabdariffa TaxID=183260 RepID=A0ABR2NCF7_9ROSI
MLSPLAEARGFEFHRVLSTLETSMAKVWIETRAPNQRRLRIMPENFFTEADKENIVSKKSSDWWFWKEGIEFDDDTKMKIDVVTLATDYDRKKKLKTILLDPFRSLIEYHPSEIMPLYR